MANIPPKIQDDRNYFGFTARDGFIAMLGVLALMVTLVIPIDFTLKIVLCVIEAMLTLAWVFVRLPSGYTLEEWVWFYCQFISRQHYYVRDTDEEMALTLTGPHADLRLVPSRPRRSDYLWMIWRKVITSELARRMQERAEGFYALSRGEPVPAYYRETWIRELAGFVLLADRNSITNFIDLAGFYPRPNFWAIVTVMLENKFLEWRDDKTLICRDPRRMRTMIRKDMVTLPETDNGLFSYRTQI